MVKRTLKAALRHLLTFLTNLTKVLPWGGPILARLSESAVLTHKCIKTGYNRKNRLLAPLLLARNARNDLLKSSFLAI